MLPSDAQDRKDTPIYSGVLRYFPDALAEVARVSKVGNDQHNPGEPLHWAKEKSTDEGDALIRHQLEAGTFDTDGTRHSAKVAWRALAQLQRELDADAELFASLTLEQRDAVVNGPAIPPFTPMKVPAPEAKLPLSNVVRDGLGRDIDVQSGEPVRRAKTQEDLATFFMESKRGIDSGNLP